MRIWCCLPVALVALTTPAASQNVSALSLTYAIHVGGVHVLDADAEMALGPNGYQAGLKMATDGFLGRVAQWKTDVRAQGHLDGSLPRPQKFTAHGSWRDQPRMTTLEYAADGTPNLTLADPAPEKDREPVPADLRLGTVDPVTAIMAVLDKVAKAGTCDITVPVYDGRQRYDLVFASQGERMLEATDLSVYSGLAKACSVQYKPLAGRWKENRSRDRDREGAKRRDVPVTLYIAPAKSGGPLVPVRLEMDSMLGAVKVHLASITTGGRATAAAFTDGPTPPADRQTAQ